MPKPTATSESIDLLARSVSWLSDAVAESNNQSGKNIEEGLNGVAYAISEVAQAINNLADVQERIQAPKIIDLFRNQN